MRCYKCKQIVDDNDELCNTCASPILHRSTRRLLTLLYLFFIIFILFLVLFCTLDYRIYLILDVLSILIIPFVIWGITSIEKEIKLKRVKFLWILLAIYFIIWFPLFLLNVLVRTGGGTLFG